MKRVWLWWSSGKDSAWALHELRRDARYEVAGLVTTVNDAFDRVAMHAVRRDLLEAQAHAVGIELHAVPLPHPCPNEAYEKAFSAVVSEARSAGVDAMAFGDLFLEDVRAYRVGLFRGTGIEPVFPLWGRDTSLLAREMVLRGARARVTCVDPKAAPRDLAGRELDDAFLDALPDGVDPCGERGEFHTFAFDGPAFTAPVLHDVGETLERDGFVFTDLILRG